jgi:hypothetical protein
MIVAVQWDKYVNHKEGSDDAGKKEVETLVNDNTDDVNEEDINEVKDQDKDKDKNKDNSVF